MNTFMMYVYIYILLMIIIWVILFKYCKTNKDNLFEDIDGVTNGELLFIVGFYSIIFPITITVTIIDFIFSVLRKFLKFILPKEFINWFKKEI